MQLRIIKTSVSVIHLSQILSSEVRTCIWYSAVFNSNKCYKLQTFDILLHIYCQSSCELCSNGFGALNCWRTEQQRFSAQNCTKDTSSINNFILVPSSTQRYLTQRYNSIVMAVNGLNYDGEMYRWLKSLKDLKVFVEKSLNIKGRWISPGGDVKKRLSFVNFKH